MASVSDATDRRVIGLLGFESISDLETFHDEYEDKSEKMEFVDEKHQLTEDHVNEEEVRKWEGFEEDWEDFNKEDNKK